MAAHCEVCGKQRRVANNVSHSNIKTKSIQRPNLRRVHAKLASGDARRTPRLHPLPAHGLRRQGVAARFHVARTALFRARRRRACALQLRYGPAGNNDWQTRPIVT